MGLAELFIRDTQYTATDTTSGQVETFTIVDNLRPDWAAGPYSGGMALPGAWRCALLRSDLLGQVPWHAYRASSAGAPPERIIPTPPFLEQPSPPDARITTVASMELDLIWHGNAIALIAGRDRRGWPTSYLPIPAEGVHVMRAQARDATGLPAGTIAYQIGGRWYPSSDVIHVKGPTKPGALRGMGVLELHLAGTLGLAKAQAQEAATLGTSGVPTGVLKNSDPEADQTDADELKAAWMLSQRTRTIAVLNHMTEFEAVAWNPTETQLLEARKFSLHEQALIFGVDPSWLGVAGSSMTYANIESQATNLVKFTLAGDLARFEQTLSLHMPRGTEARANLDAILRGDTLGRYQAHALAHGRWLTDDEIRALENRPPLTPAQRAAMTPAPPPPAPAAEDGSPTPDDPESAT